MKYKTKPVEIEAFPYIGDWDEAIKWANNVSNGNGTYLTVDRGELFISTLEGKMHVPNGWYIICGLLGEFYACRSDAFFAKYEVAE